MTSLTFKISLIILALAVAVGLILVRPERGHANPSFFVRSPGSTSATTTLKFMTPGTATTTETFNGALGSSQAVDSAILHLYVVSSTSVNTLYGSTTVKVTYEYSDDCSTWGQSNYLTSGTTTQITTGPFPVVGGTAITATSTPTELYATIPMPAKCVRAVATIPAGNVNGAVWMQFIGQRQASY